MKIVIATRLTSGICKKAGSFSLISFRKLSVKETALARASGIRRFYLPSLSPSDGKEFEQAFDNFWDDVAAGFPHDHLFWRNTVSSKMQAWGNSIGYLCLVLFTLTRLPEKENLKLIIVCNSLEMKKICLLWAGNNGWQLIAGKIKCELYGRFVQKMTDIMWFFIRFISYTRKKILSAGSAPGTAERKAVLIPSLFYPDSVRDGLYNDPFFGRLHEYIRSKGHHCVYLCVPLNRATRSTLKKVSQCRDATVITTYSLVGWKDLISIFLSLYFRKPEIPERIFMNCGLSGYIRWYSGSFRQTFSIDAAIYFEAVRRLSKAQQFSRLIISYEGNVYERACIQAFRSMNSGKVIGYSHAVIYPLNLKIRLTEIEASRKPVPDKYICTGPYAKELLLKEGKGYKASELSDGCVLKDVPEIRKDNNEISDKRKILVALDGVETAIVMLEWCLEHLGALRDFTFKVRFHPNISRESILGQCINPFPDNVGISDIDLKEDIEESLCVLYRHSSVGMQAILNGVPAIHLAIDSPLCGDPLEGLTSYKWRVNALPELAAALEEIISLSREQRETLLNTASIFVKKYYTNPTEESLYEFIS
ncbi:MAG: hypothetical protein Q7U10_06065 [Thermodesulfovibrionia bacterium]|nr:hypothetical protein [Thermodesulfovibrionia bacterium]